MRKMKFKFLYSFDLIGVVDIFFDECIEVGFCIGMGT